MFVLGGATSLRCGFGLELEVRAKHVHFPAPRLAVAEVLTEQCTYLANELCILLTKSKLLIASPLNAGVNGMVKSLKCCRFSPRSMPSTLFTMFRRATLAQALLAVYTKSLAIVFTGCHRAEMDGPDWQTRDPLDSLLLAYLDHPPANEIERSGHRWAYCRGSSS